MPKKKTEQSVAQETVDSNVSSFSEEEVTEQEEMTPDTEEELESNKKSLVEELGVDEKLLHDVSRANSRLETMGKKKKKEVYASEHVYTEYGERDIETESTKKKTEYTELVASQKSLKILEGKITGFHYADENNPTSTILAEIKYQDGLWDVLIPSYLLFDYELDEKYASIETSKTIEKLVTKRIGGNVDFVVQTITKEGIALADRLLAMSLKSVHHYTPQKGKPARIQPGFLVEGTITMVSRTFVIAEALGAEMKIPQDELSWFHIGDAREEFKVGQKVIIRVLSVNEYQTKKYNNKYTLIDVKGSIRKAQKDNREKYYKSFRIGGRYAATVTYVEENVFVNLAGKMDAMVAFPKFGEVPVRGEERIVEITGKDDEKMFIYGVFVNN